MTDDAAAARLGPDPSAALRVNRVQPAYQQVADQLRDRILDGSVAAGDRLPTEVELSEIFGVSRSTVREALRVLASRGLIRTTRGTTGGTFFGLPVVLSENVPSNPGSGDPVTGAGARLILAKASEIMLADDGDVMLDASNQASLEMDSAPTSPPTASTVLVSLWQHNMVGIRAERFINWTKRRAGAVQYIDSAKYGTA